MLSKLTLVSLTDALKNHIFQNSSIKNLTWKDHPEDKESAVSIYWQLLLVMVVPNLLTFLRCLCFGFLGKTTNSYPWPKRWAAILVSNYCM